MIVKFFARAAGSKLNFCRRTQPGDQYELPDPEPCSELEVKHQNAPCRWLQYSQIYLLLNSKVSNSSWVNDKCYCFSRAGLEKLGTIISHFFLKITKFSVQIF